MKAVIRIIRGILILVWGSVLAVGILLYLSAREDNPPEIFGYGVMAVSGAKMEPELAEGDLAFFQMGQPAQPGQVVLYRQEGVPRMGRIIGTSEGRIIVRADGEVETDGVLLDPSEPEGVLSAFLPGFAQGAEFLMSPAGIAAVGVGGILIIFLPGMLMIPPEPKRRRSGYESRH